MVWVRVFSGLSVGDLGLGLGILQIWGLGCGDLQSLGFWFREREGFWGFEGYEGLMFFRAHRAVGKSA